MATGRARDYSGAVYELPNEVQGMDADKGQANRRVVEADTVCDTKGGKISVQAI